jgi:hypothetical protein
MLLWHASDNVDIGPNTDFTQDDSSPQGGVLRYAGFPAGYDSRYVVPGGLLQLCDFTEPDGSGTLWAALLPFK